MLKKHSERKKTKMVTLKYLCEKIRSAEEMNRMQEKVDGKRQYCENFSLSLSKTYNDLIRFLRPGTQEDGSMALSLTVTADGLPLVNGDLDTFSNLVITALLETNLRQGNVLSATCESDGRGTECQVIFFPMENKKRVPNVEPWVHPIHPNLPSIKLQSAIEERLAAKFNEILVSSRKSQSIDIQNGYMPALINYVPNPYQKEYDQEILYTTLDVDAHIQTVLPFDEVERISNNTLQYFTTGPEKLYFERSQKPDTEILPFQFMARVKEYIKKRYPYVESKDLDVILNRVHRGVYGNYILEPLIDADDISDIMVLSPDKVRVKVKGRRFTSNLKFLDAADYFRFIYSLALRHELPLYSSASMAETAISVFSDIHSNKKFRMRINITTPYINSAEYPYLHIRKIAKNKRGIDYLIGEGMMDEVVAAYLVDKARNGKGMIFTGKGSSGKTSLMNALLDKIPFDKSGLVIQETDELFSDLHPHLMVEHLHGKYDLQELAKNGLLTDLDYFIIGEVKGAEAKYFINAADTGHRCWCSVHSPSSTDAIDKLADYIMYETDYSKEEAIYMLKDLGTVVFLKDYKVYEISEISGYDFKEKKLIYTPVYKRPIIRDIA